MKSLLIAAFLLLTGVSFSQIKLNKEALKKSTEKAVKKETEKSTTPQKKSNLNNARKRPGTKAGNKASARKRPGTQPTSSGTSERKRPGTQSTATKPKKEGGI